MLLLSLTAIFLAGVAAFTPTTTTPWPFFTGTFSTGFPGNTTGPRPPTAFFATGTTTNWTAGFFPTNWTGFFPNWWWFYRGEFQFLDFQMNQTTPFTNTLVDDIEVWGNVTYGPHPTGQTTVFSSPFPNTTEGYTQFFAGNYNGGAQNIINIDRTYTTDNCGFNYTTGYINVWVRPLTGTDAGVFQEGYYTCFFNFTFPPTFTTKVNSTWSPVFECSSGFLNNYSFKLWYQFRFYNIPSTGCTSGQFITI
jgi:hypothetical protein